MEELALSVRTFVYTMICFQCLIQLSVGNSFHKYLKLFSQLLALCICCNIFFSFFGIVEDGWEQADRIYGQWQKQWRGEEALVDMEGYLEKQITEDTEKEFEYQITVLLEEEGKGRYELAKLIRHDENWEIILKAEQLQENDDFAEQFQEAVCKKFSFDEEQLEVRIR